MQLEGIHHVSLHVSDVTKSAEFYRRVLMLEQVPRPGFPIEGAWFRLAQAQQLHLIGRRDQPVHSSNLGSHFALRVDDVPAYKAHLDALGVEFLLRTRPDGAEMVFVKDPDGHVFELFSEPYA